MKLDPPPAGPLWEQALGSTPPLLSEVAAQDGAPGGKAGLAIEKVDGGGASGAFPALADGTPLRQVPASQCLRLDKVRDGYFVLTNIATWEKVTLIGEHELVIDDISGDAVVLRSGGSDGDEAQILEIDELMTRSVFEDRQGCRFLGKRSADGAYSFSDWDAQMRRFRSAKSATAIGGGAARFEFECFVFARGRGVAGNRCWWSLNSLYKYLGLVCYTHFCGRWVSRSRDAWKKQWAELVGGFVSDELVHAADDRGQSAEIQAMRSPARCLPQPAVSTFALLASVLRWYVCHQNKGGMMEPNVRAAASALISALVGWVCAGVSAMKFVVELDAHWAPRWPAPALEPDGEFCLELHCEDGHVDLSPIQSSATERHPHPVAAQMWKVLATHLLGERKVPLQKLLEVCMVGSATTPLAGQLLVAVSSMLEVVMGKKVKGAGGPATHHGMKWTDRRLLRAPLV